MIEQQLLLPRLDDSVAEQSLFLTQIYDAADFGFEYLSRSLHHWIG